MKIQSVSKIKIPQTAPKREPVFRRFEHTGLKINRTILQWRHLQGEKQKHFLFPPI